MRSGRGVQGQEGEERGFCLSRQAGGRCRGALRAFFASPCWVQVLAVAAPPAPLRARGAALSAQPNSVFIPIFIPASSPNYKTTRGNEHRALVPQFPHGPHPAPCCSPSSGSVGAAPAATGHGFPLAPRHPRFGAKSALFLPFPPRPRRAEGTRGVFLFRRGREGRDGTHGVAVPGVPSWPPPEVGWGAGRGDAGGAAGCGQIPCDAGAGRKPTSPASAMICSEKGRELRLKKALLRSETLARTVPHC